MTFPARNKARPGKYNSYSYGSETELGRCVSGKTNGRLESLDLQAGSVSLIFAKQDDELPSITTFKPDAGVAGRMDSPGCGHPEAVANIQTDKTGIVEKVINYLKHYSQSANLARSPSGLGSLRDHDIGPQSTTVLT